MDDNDLERNQKEIQASLNRVSGELKTFAEESAKQMKRNSQITEELKLQVDAALVEKAQLEAQMKEVTQRLAELDSGGARSQHTTSPGATVAGSEEFKTFDGGRGGSARFTVKMRNLALGVRAAILEDNDAAGGVLIQPQRVPGIIMPPMQRLTIRDLLTWGRTTNKDIEFVRESGFTNNADVVSENPVSGKPESNITFELDSAKVATIAHWVHASKQVLDDAPMLQSYIDGRLRYGLALKEEAQLLKGSGVGLNINGIYTQATGYANPGVVVQAETRIDQLRLALLQAELAEYFADGIVLNPVDWAAIELTKDENNDYIVANPFGLITPTLWARPVVATKAMEIDEFLVGAFAQGAQGWDREDANVTVSTEDRDNFIKNMVTILGEERIALTVYRPEAFVKGDFGQVTSGS